MKDTVLSSLIVMIIGLTLVSVPQVSANPIVIDTYSHKQSIFSPENLSLPYASVNISLDPVQLGYNSFIYNISMDGVYNLKSTSQMNACIGFAYPVDWSGASNYHFTIMVNDEIVNHTCYTDENFLIEYYSEPYEDWTWLSGNRFAAFNVSFSELEAEVRVLSSLQFTVDTDAFLFDYIVGTAKAWNGTTFETVRMSITDPHLFNSIGFHPIQNLTEDSQDSLVKGIWNLNMSAFEYNYVRVSIRQYTQSPVGNIAFLFLLVSVPVMIVWIVSRKRISA